jgi:hypothetical protein
VAFHPTCHLELHEHNAHAHPHGLKAELIGHSDELITLEYLEALRAPIGAPLIELPQREIGGRLPKWDDLVAQMQWARDRDIATHLDGARIWESAPYYQRSHAEIAALFDTVYVSLYKALGGFAGSVLGAREDCIAECRFSRHRHGGTLWNLFRSRPRRSGGSTNWFHRCRGFWSTPAPLPAQYVRLTGWPSSPIHRRLRSFHIHIRGDLVAIRERALHVAEERRVWLFDTLMPSVIPT